MEDSFVISYLITIFFPFRIYNPFVGLATDCPCRLYHRPSSVAVLVIPAIPDEPSAGISQMPFTLTMLPTFVIYNYNHMTVNGERRDAKHFSFGMIFNERAAVIYNFSPRYFAGATLTMSNSFFDNDVTVNQNKWHASERPNPML